MGSDDPSVDPESAVAKAMVGFDLLALVAEATVGYRRKLVEGGVSAETADRMAEAYHATVLEMMKTQSAVAAVSGFMNRGRKR